MFAYSKVNIDSLKVAYKKAKSDTQQINIAEKLVEHYAEIKDPAGLDIALKTYKKAETTKSEKHKLLATSIIADAYYRFNVPDKSKDYNLKALKLAEDLRDTSSISATLGKLTRVYSMLGDHVNAVKVGEKMLEIARLTNDYGNMAQASNGLAATNFNQANYSKAIEYFMQAMDYYEKDGNIDQVYVMYRNVSMAYEYTGDFDAAFEALSKAEAYYLENNDTAGLASVYGMFGGLYQTLKKIDSSEYFLEKQLELQKTLPDDGSLTMVKGNLALVYKARKQYPKAKQMLEEILVDFKNASEDRMVAITHINLSDIENQLGNGEKALELAKKAIEYGVRSKEKEITKAGYLAAYTISAGLGNYKAALDHYRDYKLISDTIKEKSNAEKIAELRSQFEIKEKEKENELLRSQNELNQAELEKNKLVLYTISGGGILLLVLSIISFRAYRQKRKSNHLLEERNQLINQQKEAIEAQKELVEEINKEMVDSITYAKRIQNAILPTHEYVEEVLPDSFVLFKPKDIVSGDFYMVEKIGDKVLFGAIDCTGHGVPGALMSIVGHNGLTRAIGENQLDTPAKILDFLHHNLSQTFSKGQTRDIKDGMDAALCTFNYKTLELEFAGAMNPLYIINGSELKETKGDKMAIGSQEKDSNYTNHQFQLEKGDAVYIFSDGFADQFGGEKGKKFKYKPFKDLLLSIHSEPAKLQHEKLDTTFEGWKGNLQQIDDVCIIGVKV